MLPTLYFMPIGILEIAGFLLTLSRYAIADDDNGALMFWGIGVWIGLLSLASFLTHFGDPIIGLIMWASCLTFYLSSGVRWAQDRWETFHIMKMGEVHDWRRGLADFPEGVYGGPETGPVESITLRAKDHPGMIAWWVGGWPISMVATLLHHTMMHLRVLPMEWIRNRVQKSLDRKIS